jgi:hypothetical protein
VEEKHLNKAKTIRGLSSDQVWDFENGYYWFAEPNRIAKMLAHFEIYKEIQSLEGIIAEFGVYKGASLVRFATFQKILQPEKSRSFVAFDAFGQFPRSGDANDQAFVERFENEGGVGLKKEEISSLLQSRGLAPDLDLVSGDIMKTLPQWLAAHPDARFALLHIDVDIYEPAKLILASCWERLLPGGILVLDDYKTVEGETRAVDEFLSEHPGLAPVKTPLNHIPWTIKKPFS